MSSDDGPQRPNCGVFAQAVYDELDRLQQLDSKGTMTVEKPTDWQFVEHPRIVVNREACLRNLTWDYELFAVTYDLNWAQKALRNAAGHVVQEKRTNAKGTMLFPDFDAFFAYFQSLPAANRHFYHRNWADQPIPFVMDIDDLSKDDENDPLAFRCAADLLDRLCEDLNDFVGACEDVGTTGMFTPDDFCVFVCDKWDKNGKEIWSLHLHHKDYWFEDPVDAKEFFRLFHVFLREHAEWPENDNPLGIDLSIYNKYHSLRLPGCCKKERDSRTGQQIVRTLQRMDRFDGTPAQVAESLRHALMVKTDPDMDLRVEVRVVGAVERLPLRKTPTGSVPLTDHNPSVQMSGIPVPDLMKRMQDLVIAVAFPECPANQMPQVMHANEHRVVFKSSLPFECKHCNRQHTGNTNFMLTTDKPYDDPSAHVVMKCFQRGCHEKHEEYSMDLGRAKCETVNYTFSVKSCQALIEEAADTVSELKEKTEQLGATEKEIPKLKRKVERATDRGRDTTELEEDLRDAEEDAADAKEKIKGLQEKLKEQQVVALEYVNKFFKVVRAGEGGGHVWRLEFRHDPSDEGGIDKVIGHTSMGGANQFRKVTAHTQYDTLTYNCDDKSQNVFELWWVWDRRSDCTGIGYYPSGGKGARQNPHHFNTFFGLAFEYEPNFLREPEFQLGGWWPIAEKFFPSTLQVFCDRTEFGCDFGRNQQTYFLMWWIRCLLHTPGDTTPVMPVLYGRQGSGKTLIARMIEELVGRHNTKTVTGIPDLFGHFNAHICNNIYFIISEIGQLNGQHKNPDQESEQNLKDILDSGGERTKHTTRKGHDSEAKVITMWLLGTTNYEECVEVDPYERRKNPVEGDRIVTPQYHYKRMLDEISDRRILKIMFHWFYEMPPADTLGAGHVGANTNFFRDPANLPQTPYVKRLKQLQSCTAKLDDDVIKILTECIMKFKGELDQPNELLFDKPLISVRDEGGPDEELYEAIDMQDLMPLDGVDYVMPARNPAPASRDCPRSKRDDWPNPSYIRIPVKYITQSLDFRGIGPHEKLKQLRAVIQSAISLDYREWYRMICAQKVQKVGRESVRCFIIPYGDGACELLRVARAVLGN